MTPLSRGFGLPRWLSDKELDCQCSRHKRHGFDPWVGKIPWRRKWQLTPVFLPGESHGQRILADCSPWGHRVGHGSTHTHIVYRVFVLSVLYIAVSIGQSQPPSVFFSILGLHIDTVKQLFWPRHPRCSGVSTSVSFLLSSLTYSPGTWELSAFLSPHDLCSCLIALSASSDSPHLLSLQGLVPLLPASAIFVIPEELSPDPTLGNPVVCEFHSFSSKENCP